MSIRTEDSIRMGCESSCLRAIVHFGRPIIMIRLLQTIISNNGSYSRGISHNRTVVYERDVCKLS